MVTAEQRVRERLATDTVYFAEHCITIVDQQLRRVPLHANATQLKLEAAMQAQRDAGKPIRILVPKARKTGVSTWMVATAIRRTTQQAHHRALEIAQDNETAKELLRMAELMHSNLPEDEIPGIKPPIASQRSGRELRFGERSRNARERGLVGLDSALTIDTAREFEAKRGFTVHTLHCTEVAFWPDVRRKLTSLLNTVPDTPETLIALESTSNGFNEWKRLCDMAVAGESDYALVFIAWFEDPSYTRPFANEEDRHDFQEQLGQGEYGEAEPELVEMGCTLEQLHWRRHAIANRCQGDLRIWSQEYPSTLEESFLSANAQVFNPVHVQRVIRQTQETDKDGKEGVLVPAKVAKFRGRHGMVERATSVAWKPRETAGLGPRHAYWKVWEQPKEGDQYVIAVDPASDEINDDGDSAYHAIEIVNHGTRMQCAEYRTRGEADLIAVEALLAGLHYNNAWIAVEKTGGYGIAINNRLWQDFHYPFVYRRRNLESRRERAQDRLGWDSNRQSKPVLIAGLQEMLREDTHGIRSYPLARELLTYVKQKTGTTGPDTNAWADLLMSYMIAQQVAHEKPLRSLKQHRVTSTGPARVVNPVTGY